MAIIRHTASSDGIGGYNYSDYYLYSDVACRIQPRSGREEITLYNKEATETTHVLFCDSVYSFIEGDVVEINNKKYDVQLVRNIDLMDHHIEANLRKIEPSL